VVEAVETVVAETGEVSAVAEVVLEIVVDSGVAVEEKRQSRSSGMFPSY